MKKLFTSSVIVACSLFYSSGINNVFAQESSHPKMSAYTKLLLKNIESKQERLKTAMFTKGSSLTAQEKEIMKSLSSSDGTLCIDAFVKKTPEASFDAVADAGAVIKSINGDVAIVSIPVDKMEIIQLLDEVVYIEASVPMKTNLDVARQKANIDSIQNGQGFTSPYRGSGVIVGLVDIGFDFTHPNFYDETGTNYRISNVQIQGSTYTDYTSPSDIQALETDNSSDIHGTHTSGIAGGAGYTTAYRGIAPESELMLVGTNMGTTGIAEGVKYIFGKAGTQACAVNLSLGSHIGAHDGSSLFEQELDSYAGDGKIIVVAAGNEGNTNIHLQKQFNAGANDNLVKTILTASSATSQYGVVDVWGRNGCTFEVSVGILNSSGTTASSTSWISSASSSASTQNITAGGYSFQVILTPAQQTSPYNNTNVMVEIIPSNGFSTSYPLTVSVQNTNSGLINMWATNFTLTNQLNSSSASGYTSGDDNYTVGIPGTANNVITVGAYCTKNTWMHGTEEYSYNPLPTLGNIASFSSLGPTADGRIKPEITAPGFGIVSSFNSYDAAYTWDNSVQNVQQVSFNSNNYCWGILQGTSMACPVVTGTVALLLEVKPNLNASDVINIFSTKSTVHNLSPATSYPNNTWGYGTLNATQVFKEVLKEVGMDETFVENPIHKIRIYPNPADCEFNIEADEPILQLSVYDLTGRLIMEKKYEATEESRIIKVNNPNLGSGIYTIRVKGLGNEKHDKLIIK